MVQANGPCHHANWTLSICRLSNFYGWGEPTLHLLCQQYEKSLICHEGSVNIGYWLRSCVNQGADATGGLHPIVGNFTPKLRGVTALSDCCCSSALGSFLN